MPVSYRQRQMLELLMDRKDDMTAGQIAEELGVSVRTIHREMDEVEAFLHRHGIRLQRKAGAGIRLQEQEDSERLRLVRAELENQRSADYSAEERQLLILCELLETNSPIKLFYLAHELKVTIPTVGYDLNRLEQWLEPSGLTLIRRRGYGVQICGMEMDKRKAIWLAASENLDDSDLYVRSPEVSSSPIESRLLHLCGKSFMAEVDQVLWKAEEQWPSHISEHTYTNLMLRLSIGISRFHANFSLDAKKVATDEENTIGDNDRNHSVPARGEVARKNSISSSVAMGMTHMLAAHLSLTLPLDEFSYLAELFEQVINEVRSESSPEDHFHLLHLVNQLIDSVEEMMGLSFSEDRTLREGLLLHLRPALERLGQGERIRNPLLPQIRRDYASLFLAVQQAAGAVIQTIEVPDEEVGFITMHFGASLERFKQLGRGIRALLVCRSGIGSSRMLSVRINREFPQIEVTERVTWLDAERIPASDYDLIISTIDLPNAPNRYIKVSPFLTEDEAERLRVFIRENVPRERRVNPSATRLNDNMTMLRLSSLQATLNSIVGLINRFEVFHFDSSQPVSLEEAIGCLCQYGLEAKVLDDPEMVTEQILTREQFGSLRIPDSNVALFHTRSPSVSQPWLALLALPEPIPLIAAEDGRVSRLLLMLGPQELGRENLEVLSEISALLLLPELVRLLEEGDEEQIRRFLADRLQAFYQNIIKMES
ncbi:MAG: BglG family transcription antiterminator [Gorillibacterium sp.]|nr:BglG family transcription antiterminator [Gorillibacterium sp.]